MRIWILEFLVNEYHVSVTHTDIIYGKFQKVPTIVVPVSKERTFLKFVHVCTIQNVKHSSLTTSVYYKTLDWTDILTFAYSA